MALSFKEKLQKYNKWHDPKTGRFTSGPGGSAGSKVDSKGRGLTAAQAEYFADSKAVDEDGDLVVVYHGTVNDFTVFDKSYANPESDMGAGFYLSNSKDDSDYNYGDEFGPDLRVKISRMQELLEEEGMDSDEALRTAEETFITAEPQTMECYVDIKNPVYIGGDKATFFDFDDGYDAETDTYNDGGGPLVDLADKFADVIYYGDLECWDADRLVETVQSRLYEEAMDWGGLNASEVVNIVKEEAINFEVMASNRFGDGYLAGGEAVRALFEEMGYDGVIDNTVSGKFRGMNNMNSDTTHYIVFNSNQIKLVSNQNPTNNEDITKAIIELDIVEGV
jgi:hypothetical protein